MDTYIKFARKAEAFTDEQIIKYFSYYIYIVDEVHNLIVEDELATFETREEAAKRQIRVYKSLQRIFTLAQNTKIILLSATPMINSTKEIIQIMNLILKDNKFPENFDIDNASIKELEPYFRGQISYTRAVKSQAVPIEMVKPNKKKLFFKIQTPKKVIDVPCNLWISEMSEHQAEGYLKTIKGKGFGKIGSEQLQSSIFVFPDGNFGMGLTQEERKAIKEYKDKIKKLENAENDEQIHILPIKIESNRAANRYFNMADDIHRTYIGIKEEFRTFIKKHKGGEMGAIKQLGCKVYEVIKLTEEQEGISFVYSDYKTSGVYCVAACLETLGYSKFNEDENNIFEVVNGVERIKKSFHKKKRYVLFTQNLHKNRRETILKLLNHKDNRHGEYLKVFLSSRVGRDGISLSNVLQTHILNPSWNEAGMYQAKARGLRATSHQELIKELPPGETLEIKIYNHCAFLPGKKFENGEKSIDFDRYQLSKNKDYQIKRIMRIMKRVSNNCQLSKKRNIRPGVDKSPECDYDVCNYECYAPLIFDPKKHKVNTVNYNLFFSSEKVDEIIKLVLEKYRYYNSFIFEEICGMTDSDPVLVSFALEKIIDQKISFPDRFGYTSYLREDRGCFYTERSYPHGNENTNCSMSYYTQGIIAMESNDIDKISNLKEEKNSNIVEEAILKRFNKEKLTEKEKEYLDKYQVLIYNIGKPKEALDALDIREVNKSTVALPGVKSDKIKALELTEEEYERYMKNEYGKKDQYIHILSSTENRMVNYAASIGFEKAYSTMRLLDLKDYKTKGIGWRNLTESEKIIYNKIISYINSKTYSGLEEKFDFYGTRLPGKNFLIKDLRAKKTGSKYFKRDSSGTACEGYNKKELFELMWRMNIDISKYVDEKYKKNPKFKLDTLKDISKEKLYNELLKKKAIVKDPNVGQHLDKSKIDDEPFNQWSAERLLYYHNIFKYLVVSKSKERESIKFCNMIENEMKERGQIIS